jgi:hypothetical protein
MKYTALMSEIKNELQSVVKSIQELVDSVASIINQLDTLVQADSSRVSVGKRTPVRKKVVVKNGVVEKIKRIPATQVVFNKIKLSAQGMDTTELMKVTGFNQRKIHNITFRLKKQGLIVSIGRGVYKKV